MKPIFKFPFTDQVEHSLSFVRKSTSFAYVMKPDELNYGNALYETLQILGSIPVKNIMFSHCSIFISILIS